LNDICLHHEEEAWLFVNIPVLFFLCMDKLTFNQSELA